MERRMVPWISPVLVIGGYFQTVAQVPVEVWDYQQSKATACATTR